MNNRIQTMSRHPSPDKTGNFCGIAKDPNPKRRHFFANRLIFTFNLAQFSRQTGFASFPPHSDRATNATDAQ
jgi:hypothetical protein